MAVRPGADLAVAVLTVGSPITVQIAATGHKILQIYRLLKHHALALKRLNVLYGIDSGFFRAR